MRKSLFSKIFITQLLVSLTIIFLVVPMLFLLIGDYFVSQQEKYILQDAVRVAQMTKQISEYEPHGKAWEIFEKGIEFAGSQSMMVVLDAEGKILSRPKNAEGVNISAIGKEYVNLVRGGNSVVKIYYKNDTFAEQTLVAIAPIEDVDAVSGKVEFLGASMALRPMP